MSNRKGNGSPDLELMATNANRRGPKETGVTVLVCTSAAEAEHSPRRGLVFIILTPRALTWEPGPQPWVLETHLAWPGRTERGPAGRGHGRAEWAG